jgi:hypothetical protein
LELLGVAALLLSRQDTGIWSQIVTEHRNLPHLEILLVDKLILHEYHDDQRTPSLVRGIEESGVLRNPPIVVPLEDGSGRFVVLDGANRATALRTMGVPHTVAQVVQMDDPGLELNPWNHVVWGTHVDTMLDWARSVPELNLLPSEKGHLFRDLLDIHSLAMLHLADGRIYTAYTELIELKSRVRVLNELVKSYADHTSMDRTTNFSLEPLQELYPELSGLVLLPLFPIEDVLNLAGEGQLMPAGSTRFTISGRALHVNFPLGVLSSDKSLEHKRKQLKEWLQDSMARKRVRYYAEPTFMFDE